MKYRKPEVAVLAAATKAIEFGEISKPSAPYTDSVDETRPLTNGAYQADE